MEDLKEIVQFLTKNKTSKIEIIGQDPDSDSLFNRFYNGLCDEEFEDDASAAKALYDSTPQDNRYIKLKYELRKRILNTVFFVDINAAKFNSQEKAFIQCHKNYATVKLLMAVGKRNSGIKIAEKTINTTLKYEYTTLALEYSRLLFMHYSIHKPDKKKKTKYQNLAKKLQVILQSEMLVEQYYAEIRSEFALKKGAYSDNLVNKAKLYSRELTQDYANISSKRFNYFSNALLLLSFQLNAEHENVIDFSKKAAIKFKKNLNRNGAQINYLRVIVSLITIQNFKEAKWYFENEETFRVIGDRNWFTTQELKFIYFLYSREYQAAFNVFLKVSGEPNLSNMSILTQETWMLNEAYVQLFIEFGIINPMLKKQNISKFKMGKFINNTPIATKDKQGLNVQILTLQVIFLLRRDKIDQALNKMQILHQYSGKYLKKDYSYRSNVFIKMLIVLIRNQMHKEAVNRKAAKYLKMLKEHPIEKSKQFIGIEVVPYEHLWELIIADTKNEFRFTPAKVKKIEAAFGSRRRTPKAKK